MLSERNLFLKYVGQTSREPLLLEIDRAEGIWLYGPDGQKYLDLVSGVSVSNVGHSHPDVKNAVKDQLEKYMHLMVYGEMIQTPQVKYAELLIKNMGGNFGSVYFVNSGSEAIEGAMKLAKRYTGRSKIVSFNKSYHGSTQGALSIQGSEFYRNAYRPLLPQMFQVDFNSDEALDEIDEQTAAVIVEPVQAEAGIILPEDNFLYKLREKCNQTGALLVFDEIQTGFGRVGDLFAMKKFNVYPDIITIAKAMGGGMPLGAFVSSEEIMDCLSVKPALGHITTFGGHPVSCAAGMAALKVILKEELHIKSLKKGEKFIKNLNHPAIKGIRGSGLFLAVELNSPELLDKFMESSLNNRMIVDRFLFCNNAFRIAPPLTITEEEIDQASEMVINSLH